MSKAEFIVKLELKDCYYESDKGRLVYLFSIVTDSGYRLTGFRMLEGVHPEKVQGAIDGFCTGFFGTVDWLEKYEPPPIKLN